MKSNGESKKSFKEVLISKLHMYSQYSSNLVLKVLKSYIFITIALAILILSIYYQYLNSLYSIDEVYEGTMLRELTINEKVTIIVLPPHGDGLKQFVNHYSICKSVHDIKIIWNSMEAPPTVNKYFTFSKTHSKVQFITSIPSNNINDKYLLPYQISASLIESEGRIFNFCVIFS
jgi:hypothetical protein